MGRREGRAADEVLRCCAQAGLGIGRGGNPVGEEAVTPLVKNETLLGSPLFLTGHRCRSRASTRAFRCRF
jgi:hypothetical protein